jgi:glycosyltransferase involved in cell wall biosynthesis
MRVGYVLGDLTTGRHSTFPALVQELEQNSMIEPAVIYTRGDPRKLSPSIESIKMGDYPFPPHWHRLENDHELDVIHLSNIPKWGHLPAFLSDAPVVATARGTAHWCEKVPSESGRADTKYRIDFRTRDFFGKVTLDKVFTVSDYVGETLADRAGYSRDRLITTYLGIDSEYYESDRVEPDPGLPDRYVLHVSNRSPIKNVGTLIDAFSMIADEFPEYQLVIAGRGWADELRQRSEMRGLGDRIVFLGHIDMIEELVSLYDGAELYIHPSLHETFGRPTIEAMARGTPVLTSSNCALQEVVDGCAELIDDPNDACEIARRISLLLSNPGTLSELSSKGVDRAKKFQFQNYIKRLYRRYESVI